jgi:hypothetical protein
MYDLIGDIHGHANELVTLLEQLGYDRRQGHYSHPTRKAIFVGDFIDRGPQIREALALVRPMVEAGSALAVMGNHEFNALCYHTRDPEKPGEFLRRHTPKNVHQHIQTIGQMPADELYDHLEWFRTLPLWLELDGLRVVHACFDDQQIRVIDDSLREHGGVSAPFLQEASAKGSRLYQAIDDVLKGKELHLPSASSYRDKYGHERHAMRIRWYASPAGQTYRSYALTRDPDLPDFPLPESLASSTNPYPPEAPPVFFGHYWLQAEQPSVLAPNVACLVYSVAKGGMLVAYRWDGERELLSEKFVTVRSR